MEIHKHMNSDPKENNRNNRQEIKCIALSLKKKILEIKKKINFTD